MESRKRALHRGGILSPLLANIVLNELDWWIASQWEEITTKHVYSSVSNKNKALRQSSKLKEIVLIRYCDDFKIMCKDAKTAWKIFKATKEWLKERLHLETSPEKSKVTNLKRNYSEFLGFKWKVKKGKKNKYTNRSHIKDKAKAKITKDLKEKIQKMKKNPVPANVNRYNATIIGLHNYYRPATMVNIDFSEIAFRVSKSLKSRTQEKRAGPTSAVYEKYYGKYNFKKISVAGILLFPIAGITFKPSRNFSQEINNYSEAGRKALHNKVKTNEKIMKYLMTNSVTGQGVELHDNRISLYIGQQGKCYISEKELRIGEMEIHHKKPKSQGGSDKYSNLVFVTTRIHRLIHASKEETIEKYEKEMKALGAAQIKKLNELRVLVGNHLLYKE